MQRRPRERYRIPDDGLLVRGGLMSLPVLRLAAEVTAEKLGSPGVSVFGGEGWTLEDVLAQASIPHAQVRVTSAGRLRAAGFEVEKTLGAGHYTVWLPDVEDDTLSRLADAFDSPRPNPFYERSPLPR